MGMLEIVVTDSADEVDVPINRASQDSVSSDVNLNPAINKVTVSSTSIYEGNSLLINIETTGMEGAQIGAVIYAGLPWVDSTQLKSVDLLDFESVQGFQFKNGYSGIYAQLVATVGANGIGEISLPIAADNRIEGDEFFVLRDFSPIWDSGASPDSWYADMTVMTPRLITVKDQFLVANAEVAIPSSGVSKSQSLPLKSFANAETVLPIDVFESQSLLPIRPNIFGGNDRVLASPESAIIDTGEGIDTVVYTSPGSKITKVSDGWLVNGNLLKNVERVEFTDKIVALDIDGISGSAYRIYQAAFARTPDNEGLKYWINTMDAGHSLEAVAGGFIASEEFKTLYGDNPSNEVFVTKLYNNVLGRAPEQEGFEYWVGLLNDQKISNVSTLINFSESNENQLNVIGVIENGIDLFI